MWIDGVCYGICTADTVENRDEELENAGGGLSEGLDNRKMLSTETFFGFFRGHGK